MIFNDVRKVLEGQQTRVSYRARHFPAFPDVGRWYEFETQHHDDSRWEPGNLRAPFPGPGVYRTTYRHGGWLNGTVCIEPEWWDTPLWLENHDYSIQSHYAGRSLGRIRLTHIMLRHLQDKTEVDVALEGHASILKFRERWNAFNSVHLTTWDDNPLVWVISFELLYVGETKRWRKRG